MPEKAYDRAQAVAYAHKWAYLRNPKYYDFSSTGGDCTNFVSQCIFAGSNAMNYTPLYGWYYVSLNNRSPSWTGVQYLYNFLTTNRGIGPYGYEVPLSDIEPGDIVQFSTVREQIHHTAMVVQVGQTPSLDNVMVATHTNDADFRALSSYPLQKLRCVHIEGIRH